MMNGSRVDMVFIHKTNCFWSSFNNNDNLYEVSLYINKLMNWLYDL